MKKYLSVFILAVFSVVSTSFTSVKAGETSAEFGSISGNVGFVSEYRYRGLDQSGEEPALQGGLDWSHNSGFYVGTWASNVDFNDNDSTLEVDFYGGYATELSGVSLDLSVIGYTYPGALNSSNYDFVEYAFAAGYENGPAAFSASINYTDDFFGASGQSTYYQGGIDYELGSGITASGHVGRQLVEKNTTYGSPDYTDWSAGLSYTLMGLDLSLQYLDTNIGSTYNGSTQVGKDNTAIFGVSKSF
ncbi:MAG: TorF family putative porin [Nitrospinaceae bacterium]